MSQSVSYFLMSLAVLENPRKNLRRLEANERRSSFFSSFKFRVHPRSWASSGSLVYNFLFRCPCKECISGSFRIEVLPVRLRLLPFRTTVFNLRNNLFDDDFIWRWRQTRIWSLNYAFMEIIDANFVGWSSKYYPKLRHFEGDIFELRLIWKKCFTFSTWTSVNVSLDSNS